MGCGSQSQKHPVFTADKLFAFGKLVVLLTSGVAAQSSALLFISCKAFDIVDTVCYRGRPFVRRIMPIRSAPQRGIASPQLRAYSVKASTLDGSISYWIKQVIKCHLLCAEWRDYRNIRLWIFNASFMDEL
tara:strand:+ start:2766 stop:3158 length:393 start_codon:yes stop_codon:yes gene_type:complete